MIISSATDFREAARRKLPPFLFHYLDGGAGAEQTLRANVDDLQAVKLRQRVLRGSEQLDLGVDWFGQDHALPIALAPVGLAGMYARRGEVQAVRAACRATSPSSSRRSRSARWPKWRPGFASRSGSSCTC
jgi:L-lactate dehydrogenase (cytochrome)